MTDGRSRLQPNDVFGYSKHAVCFGWFKLLLPPDAVLLQRLVNIMSTVRTNVIFWNPSSAGLRNVGGGGSQKSSVAYVQCINTVCSDPDNICCGTQPNCHEYKCWETALLMSCAVGVPVLRSRSYKHGPTANQDVLSHSHGTKLFLCFGFTHYRPCVPC